MGGSGSRAGGAGAGAALAFRPSAAAGRGASRSAALIELGMLTSCGDLAFADHGCRDCPDLGVGTTELPPSWQYSKPSGLPSSAATAALHQVPVPDVARNEAGAGTPSEHPCWRCCSRRLGGYRRRPRARQKNSGTRLNDWLVWSRKMELYAVPDGRTRFVFPLCRWATSELPDLCHVGVLNNGPRKWANRGWRGQLSRVR